MKRCATCERHLDEIHFTKSKKGDDRLSIYCRDCQRKDRIKKGLQKPEGWKRKTEDMAAYRREWLKSHKGYTTKAKRDWLKKNKKRDLVQQRVKYALKTGKLVRQPCVKCGAVPADGHHEDYDKPLEVIWLCKFHHRELHAKRKQLGQT